MKNMFGIIILIVTLFVGFLLGYSIPPFIHAGVFSSDRAEKGVEVKVDEKMEKFYEDLYKDNEEEE
jgi:hypothetical protein